MPAGSASRRAAGPPAATSVGGASSMCSEPSRLVWPTLAVALAGSSTSPLSSHRDQRVPALAFDLGDGADVDVADPDARVRFDVVHVGQLRLDGERAGTAALGARQRQRVQPLPSPQPDAASANTQHADGARESSFDRIMIRLPGAPSCPAGRRPGSWRDRRRLGGQRWPTRRAAAALPRAPVRSAAVAAGRSPAASSPRCR